jgi:hypothetical protein
MYKHSNYEQKRRTPRNRLAVIDTTDPQEQPVMQMLSSPAFKRRLAKFCVDLLTQSSTNTEHTIYNALMRSLKVCCDAAHQPE